MVCHASFTNFKFTSLNFATVQNSYYSNGLTFSSTVKQKTPNSKKQNPKNLQTLAY